MATMGLRRRAQAVPGPGSKRGRGGAENNNSPSQGNLNPSPEPAAKRSRHSGRSQAAAKQPNSKDLDLKKMALWSDPRPYASIAGLSIEAQRALCSDGPLSSPLYLSPAIANFVGAALGKQPAVGAGGGGPGGAGAGGVPAYLDIAGMTGRWASGEERGPEDEERKPERKPERREEAAAPAGPGARDEREARLPASFPDDGMYAAYQPWVIKTYGDLAKTKTITVKKYARILRTLRGEEANSAENSKFRFWVKSKGFHIGQPEGYEAKPADRIVGRHSVSAPGLDPPLYVPTQPPHNKTSNGADGGGSSSRIYKKVAIVENFFDIIHAVHVDLEGRPGKHAGQKRTYRTITETYAFLPREAVTRFLLGCTECQRRPRTPSPTSLAAAAAAAAAPTRSESPSASGTPTPADSPRPEDAERPGEAGGGSPGEPARPEPEPARPEAGPRAEPEPADGAGADQPAPQAPAKDEKYNPLSITNLLRKDPVSRRPAPPSLGLPAPPEPAPAEESARQPGPDFSPAAGLIGQNLNLLATIQQLHCQVMLALTERLRPAPSAGLAEGPERPGSS